MRNWLTAAAAAVLFVSPFCVTTFDQAAAHAAKKPSDKTGKSGKAGNKAEADDDSDGSNKYFDFYKEGVSLEKATADFTECRGYTDGIRSTSAGPDLSFLNNPYLIPNNVAGAAAFGFFGGLIAGAIHEATVAAPERAGTRRANLRICMGFKNYQRFARTKSQWEELHAGDDDDAKIARLAAFAAGPRPEGEVLSK